MKKADETEEEWKEVLQSLFTEKKRVKELQRKVQQIGGERNDLRVLLDKVRQQGLGKASSEASSPKESLPKEGSAPMELKKDSRVADAIDRVQARVAGQEIEKETTRLKLALEEAQRRFHQAQTSLTESQQEVASLKSKASNSAQGSSEQTEEHAQLWERNHKLNRAVVLLKQRYEETVRSLKKEQTKNEAFISASANSIKATPQESEKTQITALLKKKEEEADSLQARCNDLQSKWQEACQRVRNLDAAGDAAGLGQALLNEENTHLKEENSRLNEALKGIIEKMQGLKTKVTDSDKRLQVLSSLNSVLEGENDSLNERQKELEDSHKKMQESLSHLQMRLVERSEELEMADAAKAGMEAQNYQLLEQQTELEKRYQAVSYSFEEARNTLHTLQVENKEGKALQWPLEAKNAVLANKIRELEARWSQAEEGVVQKEQQLDELKEELQLALNAQNKATKEVVEARGNREAELHEWQEEVLQHRTEREAQLRLWQEEIAQHRSLTEALQKEIAEAKKENEELQSAGSDEEVKKYQEIARAAKAKLVDIKQLLEISRNQGHQHESQLEQVRKNLSEKEARISQLEEFEYSYQRLIDQKLVLEEALKQEKMLTLRLTEEKERFALQLKKKDHDAHASGEAAVFHLQKLQEMEQTIVQLQSDKESAESKLGAATDSLEKAQARSELLRQELDAKERQQQEILDKIEKIEVSLEESRQALAATAAGLEVAYLTNVETKEELRLATEEKEKLTTQLNERTQKTQEMEKELRLIRQTIVRGMREVKELEVRYLEAVNERVSAVNQYHELMRQWDSRDKEMKILQMKISESQGREKGSQSRIEELQGSLNEALQQAKGAQEKSEFIEQQRLALVQAQKEQEALLESKNTEIRSTVALKEEEMGQLMRQHAEELSKKESELKASIAEKDQELAQLREEYESLMTEREELQKQFTEELHSRIREVEDQMVQLRAVEAEKLQLEEQLQSLQEDLSASKQGFKQLTEDQRDTERKALEQGELASVRQKEIEQLLTRQQSSTQEIQQLQESVFQTQRQVDDRDSRIQISQQYLAKKVKEATSLRDLLEQQKTQMLELQNQVSGYKAKIGQLQNSIELQTAMAAEKIKSVEARAQTAENQILEGQQQLVAAQERWQQDKARLAELKNVKAEYDQMIVIFSNIKMMMGSNFTLPPSMSWPAAAQPTSSMPEIKPSSPLVFGRESGKEGDGVKREEEVDLFSTMGSSEKGAKSPKLSFGQNLFETTYS